MPRKANNRDPGSIRDERAYMKAAEELYETFMEYCMVLNLNETATVLREYAEEIRVALRTKGIAGEIGLRPGTVERGNSSIRR